MNPTFKKAFESTTCLLTHLDDCINTIETLHAKNHTFREDEFDIFITRCAYNKTKSPIATNPDKLLNVLKIMFTNHNLSQRQLMTFIGCCKLHKTQPVWVDVFLDNCIFQYMAMDKLTIIHVPQARITEAIEKSKLTIKYIIYQLRAAFRSWQNPANNAIELAIWKTLPPNLINTDLLNAVIKTGISDKRRFKVIEDILDTGVVPNDRTIKLLCSFKTFSPNILLHISKHNLVNEQMIRLICSFSNQKILLLDPSYNIKLDIALFHIMIELDAPVQIDQTKVNQLKGQYGEDHVNYAIHISNTIIQFSMYKFMFYLNITPTEETFMLLCKYPHHDQFKQCMETHKMIPTYDHLAAAVGGFERFAGHGIGTTNKYDTCASILLCRIVPDTNIFKIWVKSNQYDGKQPILELLIKFGLQLGHADIMFALENKVLIDNLERFDLMYDEQLYFTLFINNYKLTPELNAKFAIDQHILKLRAMCADRKTTYDKVKRHVNQTGVKLDRYCLDGAAKCCNRPLLYKLLKYVKVPNVGTFILLDKQLEIYDETIKFHGVDCKYMMVQYDVELGE